MPSDKVQIVHNQVTGRTRYRVPGLYRSRSLKDHLLKELRQHTSIHSVAVSDATGNVLVSYNSDQNEESIAVLISATAETLATLAAQPKPAADTTPSGNGRGRARRNAARNGKRAITKPAVEVLAKPASNLPAWHRMAKSGILEKLSTSASRGLTLKEAALRKKRHGENALPETRKRSDFEIFFEQINSLPTYLLAAAAGVSLLTGGVLDAVVVVGVVAANAAIGYATEREAEKTIHSLNNMVRPMAIVIRGEKPVQIDVKEVIPGDILVLKPGTWVGADCRIIESRDLTVDESMLTGESLPVSKHARVLKRKGIPLADRKNMAFMGTQVTGGQGKAVAVATGPYTQIGLLQTLLQDTDRPETPMERQLHVLGDQLVLMCGGVCGVVFGLGFLRGYGMMEMLRMAISLAAAAVPEGLPAAATMNFALGIRKMRQHSVLIRRLQAVETLGALQVVCLDKTGTVTWNRMSVQQIYTGRTLYRHHNDTIQKNGSAVSAEDCRELADLIRVCVLCSEVKVRGKGDGDFTLEGSATENALVQLAISAGINARDLRKAHPLENVRHRSEQSHYMSTAHRFNGNHRLLAIKGSPPEVMAMCTHQMVAGEVLEMDEEDRLELERQNARMAGEALRVLGLAMSISRTGDEANGSAPRVWLGLVGMADPIRDGVHELIESFHQAGIETVMITGDQSPTAYTVARELNLSGDHLLEILDSSDLSSVDAETLAALSTKAHVYSRVTPADKLKIVQAIKASGKTVAMTGDGINDGPALKAADLGIAMGKSGTDVAREVADVVLEDDNLETLIRSVADGRGTYSNIRKSVHFFLSTNMSEIMVMFAAMAAGIGFPLNVMQLLWINCISDIFPGLALSLETPEDDVLRRQPRKADDPLFTGADFRRMTLESGVISASTLGAYGVGLARYGLGAGSATLAFHSLTVGQLLHAYSCRSGHQSLYSNGRMPSNPYLNTAIGGSLLLQLMTVFVPPLRRLLGLGALSAADMAVVGGFSTLPLLINEAMKTRRVNHA
jgi:Ca2+-transporting ATPase